MTDHEPDIDLPRGVALAWGISANPQRGPKRELSIERIVEAAVEIADAEGLGAVSMSSVAASLGFTTMSLYRYVSAKDDLILLMQEYGTGLPPATIAETTGWREALLEWSRASLAMYIAHPWLIDIPIRGTPDTPNNLAWMDVALGALRETPLDHQERVGALLLLSGQTRWEATILRGYTEGAAETGVSVAEKERVQAQVIETLVTAEAFPDLFEAIAAGVFTDDSNPFAFGLERVLDGIATYIAARGDVRTMPPPPEHPPADSHPRDPAVKEARQLRREAEKNLREALKREREAVKRADERARHAAEKERHAAEKAAEKAAR